MFAFSLEGGQKVFNPYLPDIPTPLPINNDHSLNLFIYDSYDDTYKNLLYCFRTSGAFCWFEMGCFVHAEDSAVRFATKTPGSGHQLVLKYVHDPLASAKDNKTLKIVQI